MQRKLLWMAVLGISVSPAVHPAVPQVTYPPFTSVAQHTGTVNGQIVNYAATRFPEAVRPFATGEAASVVPLFSLRLKPGPADKEGRVGYVDVAATLQAADTPAGVPVLRMPTVIANIDTVAKTMQDFVATDTKGTLLLDAKDDAGSAPVPYRRWVPARPIVGDLNIRYRAPISTAMPKRTGPPFALRTEGGGFSGAGVVFLVEPAASKPYHLVIRWELSELGPQATGASSFGDGDVGASKGVDAAAGLSSGFFMAGPVHRYPAKPPAGGFSSAWCSSPSLSFDPGPLMAWTAKLYDWYEGFFKPVERPYRVFLRYNPVNPGGGVGLMNSFVVTYDQDTKSDSLKFTLAHEMLHTFAPALGEGLETEWFSEGLAVYYQRLLPLRAGAITPDAFLADLNETAARYYTNALNTVPNDQIAPRFWEDTRIRVLPYDRGAMYMAVVDKRLRKASGGKRSLDDVVFALLSRQKKALPTTPAVWVELITSELGPAAKEEYEAMLAGAVMLPDSDAFGPCFARTTAPLRRFELGFDSKVMGQPTRIIRDLIPGSEAERAGLRNGDEITTPVGLDSVQGEQKRTLTLQIRRHDKVFPVTYLPRGETVETYQWARVKGVADADCRY
jgi:hypothetical protein